MVSYDDPILDWRAATASSPSASSPAQDPHHSRESSLEVEPPSPPSSPKGQHENGETSFSLAPDGRITAHGLPTAATAAEVTNNAAVPLVKRKHSTHDVRSPSLPPWLRDQLLSEGEGTSSTAPQASQTADSKRTISELDRSPSPKVQRNEEASRQNVPEPATTPSQAADVQLSAAEYACWRAFPDGWMTIQTSADGFLCGWHAVILSMHAQYPFLPYPTVAELQALFAARAEEFAAVFDMENSCDFSIDQIAAILYQWGRGGGRGLNLRVGYVENGVAPLLVSHPDEGQDVRVLWVHNDGRYRDGIGHFSGLRRATREEMARWCLFQARLAEEEQARIRREEDDRRRCTIEEIDEGEETEGELMDVTADLFGDTAVEELGEDGAKADSGSEEWLEVCEQIDELATHTDGWNDQRRMSM